jgi:hypothetical protein
MSLFLKKIIQVSQKCASNSSSLNRFIKRKQGSKSDFKVFRLLKETIIIHDYCLLNILLS